MINKIVVLPLRNIQGNLDNKAGKDSVIIILNGSGSMEVNESKFPITTGDVIEIRGDEMFTLTNDTLDSSIHFISVLKK
jgi:mannose-6-phosphate isomerase-like protein (cupin superfamily)